MTSSQAAKKGQKYVLAMVGLPACGKSYTAQKLARYLRWGGYRTRVFNVGERRREELGVQLSAEFFDPANQSANEARDAVAHECFEELVHWLHEEGRIAIFDATNTVRERRDQLRARCRREGFELQFVEVINNDPAVIDANLRATKLKSPDYEGVDPNDALRDFKRRIAYYERMYEPVGQDEGPHVKIVDRNRQVLMGDIDGYVPARIVFFLINLQIAECPVWLTRHGESLYNVEDRIGGDPALSESGRTYALRLSEYVDRHYGPEKPLQVWTSSLKRTNETAEILGRAYRSWRSLDEIDAGVCDGMTYAEVRREMPEDYRARAHDKLRFRYRGGESYLDVIQRIDRVIIELERQRTPVLVIGHQAVIRGLYAYFVDLDEEEIPHTNVPLHTIIQLTPRAYECVEERVSLGAE